ncbi:MAG: hypothetical protein LUD81_07880 [Clostridiales bacterium]|nr:hypothetical protein [Clostridiales bacterium]
MIKCRMILEDGSECGKDICCYECEEKETCKLACDVFYDNEPGTYKKCFYAGDEETLLVEFENKALTVIKEIAEISRKKKDLEAKDNEMRQALEEAMSKFGVKKFDNDLISVTYINPSTSISVDTAKVKKLYPDIAAECSKTTNKKGYVKITVKD